MVVLSRSSSVVAAVSNIYVIYATADIVLETENESTGEPMATGGPTFSLYNGSSLDSRKYSSEQKRASLQIDLMQIKSIKTFTKLEMNKLLKSVRGKPQRNESTTPLVEKHNNHNLVQHGDECDNPMSQNPLSSPEQQGLQSVDGTELQELAELLGVCDNADNSEGGSFCSLEPETNSKEKTDLLLRRSVSKHFPKPPADLDHNLQQHLSNVQETVLKELLRLCPLLNKMRLMGCLIDGYHRQTFDHLTDLLQNVHTSWNSSLLMNWVLKTYLSQELLTHPDLQEVKPIENVDLLLLTEWVSKASNKMQENVQKEIRGFLENILNTESEQKDCDCEEVCTGLYIDSIQCIEAKTKEAQKISSKLSGPIQEVCFQELLTFLGSYTAKQTEFLQEKATMKKTETIHFFKTLNNCRKLKKYVQTEGKNIERSLLQENVAMLEKLEAFTLKLLQEIVSNMAESHLKKYFKTDKRSFLTFIHQLKMHFPKLSWCQEGHGIVMEKAYKCITHIYLKHLVQCSQSKLTKCWRSDIGDTVTKDAELLHNTITDLAPGVKQWNLMLLKIQDLLECTSTDSAKLTVASMQKDCLTWSEDRELLPALLRWKGLFFWQVKEVLAALPGDEPRVSSA